MYNQNVELKILFCGFRSKIVEATTDDAVAQYRDGRMGIVHWA